ncbi:transporter substrate-binding domain-containing protein [Sorangium sp. So ce448]|uniref:transporter substrate-binding domain-containing protein n=1 Tax=Sorangium sp. So ce448 TaxID=3133314 RepID=UPI003F5FA5DA
MQTWLAWPLILLAAGASCQERGAPSGGEAGSSHHGPITGVNDLSPGQAAGVQRGTTGAFYAQEILAPRRIKLVTFLKAPDMYNALEGGQIRAVISDLLLSEEVIKQKPLLKIVQQIETAEGYAFAVNKENPGLLREIDRALGNLFADGTYKALFERYFPGRRLPSYTEGVKAAPFSACPKVKTRHDETLTIGSDIPSPPFEMFTEGGDVTGFDVDLMNAVARELCLTPRWVQTNFDTIFTSLAAGKFDAVASAVTAYAPEGSPSYATVKARQQIVSFTRPYFASLLSLTVKVSG